MATVEPAAPGQPSGRRSGRGYWLPGILALGALLVIGGAVGAGDLTHPAPTSLAGSDVALQLSIGIQAQRHLTAPPAVTCPASEPVRHGWRFECAMRSSGRTVAVQVTEIDGRGRLAWNVANGAGGP
jgi:hypothetical protein